MKNRVVVFFFFFFTYGALVQVINVFSFLNSLPWAYLDFKS